MKLSASKISAASLAIESFKDQPMPAMLTYRLCMLRVKLLPIANAYEQARNQIIKENGKQIEGESFRIEQEKIQFVNDAIKALDVEEEVGEPTIPLSLLEKMNLSVAQLSPLVPFILPEQPI